MTEDDQDRAALLELMRRSLDLRIDGEGRWHHDGERFRHPRLVAFFDRGIDLHPDSNEPILRVGDSWCYVVADDTPFLVRHLELTGDELVARLNTGERLSLPHDALESREGHIYARLDPRRMARLDRTTHNGLVGLLDEGPDGAPTIGGRWVVRVRT